MVVLRGISIWDMVKWTGFHFAALLAFTTSIALLYYFDFIVISLPWLSVSIIGTAVAFYVGFKNNQAYDRMWEARKIWGGIVNDSRAWGMMVDGYITNLMTDSPVSESDLQSIKRKLIYRHIAWLYAHRSQLLVPTPWEHISQGGRTTKLVKRYQKELGVGLVDDEITRTELTLFLPPDEYERLIDHVNTATQIINQQSRDLTKLREQNILDDFRHTQMVEVLRNFYALQGKNERIKKFPLPRQYANMSRYFVGIFLVLLPFSMIPELMKIGELGIWISIPITALVGWVYVMMEVVGDYSENPFQGMPNDIPMMSLCRVIEIDLREMINETELPPKIQAKNGILM